MWRIGKIQHITSSSQKRGLLKYTECCATQSLLVCGMSHIRRGLWFFSLHISTSVIYSHSHTHTHTHTHHYITGKIPHCHSCALRKNTRKRAIQLSFMYVASICRGKKKTTAKQDISVFTNAGFNTATTVHLTLQDFTTWYEKGGERRPRNNYWDVSSACPSFLLFTHTMLGLLLASFITWSCGTLTMS